MKELDLEEQHLEEHYRLREKHGAEQLAHARLQAGYFSLAPASIQSIEEQQSQGQGHPTLGQPARVKYPKWLVKLASRLEEPPKAST